MTHPPDPAERPRRADARRNRERLLAAAATVFSLQGTQASLQGIAREAGVGIGTLYRHFPSREALYSAVYAREVADLVARAEQLSRACAPRQALREWLHALVGLVARKTGMAAALAISAETKSAVSRDSSQQLVTALDRLMSGAVDTGAIAARLDARELLQAVIGMCVLQDQPGWEGRVETMIDLLLAGLAHDRP